MRASFERKEHKRTLQHILIIWHNAGWIICMESPTRDGGCTHSRGHELGSDNMQIFTFRRAEAQCILNSVVSEVHWKSLKALKFIALDKLVQGMCFQKRATIQLQHTRGVHKV